MSLTAAQRAIRATGIGASEVSAIASLNPYAAPIDVWLEKPTPSRGPLVEANDNDHPESPIAVGHELEGALLEMLGRRVGCDFARPVATFRHPRAPHVLASPDGIARGKRGGEIKVVGARMLHHWQDGPPEYVRTQAAQNMAVTGAEVWHVGALLGGNTFRTFTIERERELEEQLVDLCETWWANYIEGDEPPPIEDPEARRRYLLARYPGSEATKGRLTNEPTIAEAAARLRELYAEKKALEAEVADLENGLCEIIGADYGIEGTWGKALWFPSGGAPAWKDIAEELAGGEVPAAVLEKHRGKKGRTFRLYEPRKLFRGRRTP